MSKDQQSGISKGTVAKYVNKSVPSGATGAKVAVIKPSKLLKIVGKSLGDTPIDVFGAGAPGTSVLTIYYTVENGSALIRHCSAFTPASCAYKLIAGDTGAKLVCKPGMPATCPG